MVSKVGSCPCPATPSPNWPRRNSCPEAKFIRPAAPPFPSPRLHVPHTPKSLSPEQQTHISRWFRKISICKSHRQRNSRCAEQDTAIISTLAQPPLPSWSQQHHNREQHKPEAWKTADTSLSHSLSLHPIGCCVPSSLSLEHSFLSLLPPSEPQAASHRFLVTMPMSTLLSMHCLHQEHGHLAKTQGWSHHLAQWLSQGMALSPREHLGNVGVARLVTTVIGRSLLWVRSRQTRHLQSIGQPHKELS